jgi:hypothetical protein
MFRDYDTIDTQPILNHTIDFNAIVSIIPFYIDSL